MCDLMNRGKCYDNRSEVNDVFFLFGERFDIIMVMISIVHQLFVLMDVVIDMPQAHLCLYSLLPYFLLVF